MMSAVYRIMILGLIDATIAVGGLYIWRFILPIMYDTVLAMIAILLAFTTYFGFLSISQSMGQGINSDTGTMRTAIASGILVPYFFIISTAIFINRSGIMSDFMQSMINNFTTTIGVIVPFYFGASAYVQSRKYNENMGSDQKDTSN